MPVTREEKKDPMRLLFPDLPVLKSTRLLLRPLEMADAQGLLRLTRQEKVYRVLPTYLFENSSTI